MPSRTEPRSVADPDAEAYDDMMRRHQALMAARSSAGIETPARSVVNAPAGTSGVDAPGAGPFDDLNFARKGREKWERGDRVDAMTDALQGLADAVITYDLARGLKKGGLKLDGPFAWRTPPWEEPGARKWLGDKGFLEKGEHGHHALIPNNGWGKKVPDAIKNQPFNIVGMEAAEHGRIHGRYKGAPQYNVLERYWRGTPRWWKASNAWLGAAAADAISQLPTFPPPPSNFDPMRFPKGSL